MSEHSYIEASDPPKGKKASQVAAIMDAVAKTDDPRPWEEICEEVGVKYPGDLQPAMHALEIAGAVKRYTYVESGSTKIHAAYARSGDAKDPSRAASTKNGSKRQSKGKSKQKRRRPRRVAKRG